MIETFYAAISSTPPILTAFPADPTFVDHLSRSVLSAHMFGDGEEGGPMSRSDQWSFAFFPIGLSVGLLLAYKWEGLGGLVATASMAALFVIRMDLLRSGYMTLIALPGLLYLLYWWLQRRQVA